MAVVAQCDHCKDVGEEMHAFEVKVGKTSGQASRGVAGMFCDKCWKDLDLSGILHGLISFGAQDLQLAPQQPRVTAPNANQPIPIDPKLAQRLQGR